MYDEILYEVDDPTAVITFNRPQSLNSFTYKTLAEFTKATGQDAHSRVVDYSVFRSLKPAETETITKVDDPATIDFQIRPGSKAVDAGIPIPGVTDGFSGRAPDLGAYEIGAPLPHYGPRP